MLSAIGQRKGRHPLQAKISKIDIYAADIPFRMKFGHAAKSRKNSESIFVRVEAEDGRDGFGESLPRRYVTGEDQISVIDSLREVLPGAVLGRPFQSFRDIADFCGSSFNNLRGAARCAIELALLDLGGKVFDCSVNEALGEVMRKEVRYGVAIGSTSFFKTAVSALKFRRYGFKDIKIKVGDDEDIKRIGVVRALCGRRVDPRINR